MAIVAYSFGVEVKQSFTRNYRPRNPSLNASFLQHGSEIDFKPIYAPGSPAEIFEQFFNIILAALDHF